MGDRIFTSEEAEETLKELGFFTSMEFGALGRLALALSLKHAGKDVPQSPDARGKEIRDRSLFGPDMTTYKALVQQVHGRRFDEDEFVSRDRSVVKDHVDHGCTILKSLVESANQNKTEFFRLLAEELSDIAPSIPPLEVDAGVEEPSGKPVVLRFNDMDEHPNPHMAIMGKSGAGKTQVSLKVLADIRALSGGRTHFVLFDYKGDISDNEDFVEVSGAQVFRLPEERLPINPFVLADYDERTVTMAARAKSESFASAQARLGVVQKGRLTEAVTEAYGRRREAPERYPDLQEVLQVVEADYEGEKRKLDSLIEVLRDLARFGLFWEHGTSQPILESMMTQTIIVDLSGLEMLRELVAYMVIEQLYREMSSLSDSAIAGQYREIRTVLVIDEAHHYLGQQNIFLQRVIREGRSKGVAVFLASQSPNDYVPRGDEFSYLEHIEFPLVFTSDAISRRAAREILGCSQGVAGALPTEVARLEPFEFLTRSPDDPKGYTKCRAHPFYEAYSR